MIPDYLETIQEIIEHLKLTNKAIRLFDPQTNEEISPDTFNFLIHQLNARGCYDIYIILDLNPDKPHADLYTPEDQDHNPALQIPEEFRGYLIEIPFSPELIIHLALTKDNFNL